HLARRDGKVLIGTPLGPGAVIYGGPEMPDLSQRQSKYACGDAGAAARNHGLAEIDTGLLEQLLNLGRRFQRSVLFEELAVGQVARAGDMAGADPSARLRRTPGKALGAA